MPNIRNLIIGFAALACLTHCEKEKDTTFLIQPEQVGPITKGTPASDIENLFINDSIVRDSTPSVLGSTQSKIRIYQKGGELLLTLTPSKDSTALIENIQIHDPRYSTAENVSLNSTFKDIKEGYEIRKIVTSINNLVIFVKNNDVYFTISKEELPGSLRYNPSLSIEAVQIPDKAKIKYIMVGW
ncbi:MAG: hypothetical protein HKN89_06505 [Eudoraea sp.]|nr:hypothetical protein [Eudoraea sp.]